MGPFPLYNESTLISKVSKGDRQAFAELYTGYYVGIYNYLYPFFESKEDTEELVQEVFVKLWQRRETLAEIDSFASYLFRIARNQYLNHLRYLKRRVKLKANLAHLQNHSSNDTDHRLLVGEYLQIAHDAIQLLPEKRRQVFILSTQEDQSLDQIAASLGISKSVVKKQLYKATSFVRAYVAEHGRFSLVLAPFLTLFD